MVEAGRRKPPRAAVAALGLFSAFVAMPAAALPHEPEWTAPPVTVLIDAWNVGAAPADLSAKMARLGGGGDALHRASSLHSLWFAWLMFPRMDADAPMPPSATHEAVAPARPVLPRRPLAPKLAPPHHPADGVSHPWEKPLPSYYPLLMRGVAEDIVAGASLGLRDPLRSGLAMALAGPNPDMENAEVDNQSDFAGLSARAPAPLREQVADDTRRSLVVVGVLGAVAAMGLTLALRHRGDPKKPQKLRSRRFG